MIKDIFLVVSFQSITVRMDRIIELRNTFQLSSCHIPFMNWSKISGLDIFRPSIRSSQYFLTKFFPGLLINLFKFLWSNSYMSSNPMPLFFAIYEITVVSQGMYGFSPICVNGASVSGRTLSSGIPLIILFPVLLKHIFGLILNQHPSSKALSTSFRLPV